MAGMLWVSDREPGIRLVFGELLPEAELLTPDDLRARIALGQRPDALVVDGTQLLELPPRERGAILALPRVLVCTGMLLAAMPVNLVSGPSVAVLAKPFCEEDLAAALAWVRDAPTGPPPDGVPFGALVQRRRARRIRGRLPAR